VNSDLGHGPGSLEDGCPAASSNRLTARTRNRQVAVSCTSSILFCAAFDAWRGRHVRQPSWRATRHGTYQTGGTHSYVCTVPARCPSPASARITTSDTHLPPSEPDRNYTCFQKTHSALTPMLHLAWRRLPLPFLKVTHTRPSFCPGFATTGAGIASYHAFAGRATGSHPTPTTPDRAFCILPTSPPALLYICPYCLPYMGLPCLAATACLMPPSAWRAPPLRGGTCLGTSFMRHTGTAPPCSTARDRPHAALCGACLLLHIIG